MGNRVGMICTGFPHVGCHMGIPKEIMWEWDGD